MPRRSHKVERWGKPGSPPAIGPCRDPLALWFVEFNADNGQRARRYYADRSDARLALRELRARLSSRASS